MGADFSGNGMRMICCYRSWLYGLLNDACFILWYGEGEVSFGMCYQQVAS